MKLHASTTNIYFVIACLFLSIITAFPALAANELISGKPIITFDQQHGLLPDRAEPLLSIYENGTAIAVLPTYMKNAGRYSYQLLPNELQALKTSISKAGIKHFDQQLVNDSIEANQENPEPQPPTPS